MIIALTGTPGTGKSTIGQKLIDNNYNVLDLNETIKANNFVKEYDESRDTFEVDLDKLNKYLKETLIKKYLNSQDKKPGILFLEGHISHLLDNIDKIIILRCHPEVLRKRLNTKSWSEKKVSENLEAEALDVILIETLERYSENNIFEINTSNKTIDEIYNNITTILEGGSTDFNPGNIDWSEEIMKWY
jgi:adenylate kinase